MTGAVRDTDLMKRCRVRPMRFMKKCCDTIRREYRDPADIRTYKQLMQEIVENFDAAAAAAI